MTKKKLPRLTDEHILQLMQRAVIIVTIPEDFGDGSGMVVEKFHCARKRYTRLKSYCCDPGRVRYNIRLKGYALRTIYRNKLVWMTMNKRVVPPGYVIDHEDYNSMNDEPENLKLQAKEESYRQGAHLQYWDEVVGYFDFIAFTGQEPRETTHDRTKSRAGKCDDD